MTVTTLRVRPRKIAAPAPPMDEADEAERRRRRLPAEVEAMCQEWGTWVATRRLAAPPPIRSVLGRLRTPAQTGTGGGPYCRLDADLSAFNLALQMQSERAQAVLYGLYAIPALGYVRRVPVKLLAAELGIARQTVYRLLESAATRAYAQRHAVLEAVRGTAAHG